MKCKKCYPSVISLSPLIVLLFTSIISAEISTKYDSDLETINKRENSLTQTKHLKQKYLLIWLWVTMVRQCASQMCKNTFQIIFHIFYGNQRKYKWMQREVDMIEGTTAPNSEDVQCHRAAVWRCGHAFIRAHKFLRFIGLKDAFEPKCALRAAFFGCLKSSKTLLCHKQRSHTKKFRKRLADTLWSTRACLLGVDNSVSQTS